MANDMMQQHFDIPIHDIKPLLEIEEYSLYYLIALGSVVAVVILGLIYLFIRWLRHRNRFNIRREHLKLLKTVDFNDTKNAAYAITLYGLTFKHDSERHSRAYDDLVEKLEAFKYKKSVESFDKNTLHYIELYRGMLDV